MEITIPRKIKVIEIKKITFTAKDFVEVYFWEDFLDVLGDGSTIYKYQDQFMIPSNTVVHTLKVKLPEGYKDGKTEKVPSEMSKIGLPQRANLPNPKQMAKR